MDHKEQPLKPPHEFISATSDDSCAVSGSIAPPASNGAGKSRLFDNSVVRTSQEAVVFSRGSSVDRPPAIRHAAGRRIESSPEAKLFGGFGLAFAILIAVGIVQYQSIEALVETDRWVAHTQAVIAELEGATSDLQQAESATRAYVVSEREDYLRQQDTGIANFRGHLHALRRLIADHSREEHYVRHLARLAGRVITHLRELAALRRSGGFAVASQEVGKGEGLRLMNDTRAAADAMETEEKHLLVVRQAASTVGASRANTVTALGTLLAVTFVLAAGWITRRDAAQRLRAEEEIRQLNASLEQRVAERTAELEGAVQSLRREAANRAAAEETVKRLQHETELIVASAGEGIVRCDLSGACNFVNPAASRALGYTEDELIGQDLHALLRHALPDGQPCAPENCGIYCALKRGEMRQADNQILYRKDGAAIPFDIVTAPIAQVGQIIGAVATFRDVSERREMERMKDEFVSVVSHELRTPLTAMRGALGILASGRLAERPAQRRRMIEMALNNTERLSRLVNDILDVQRLEAGVVMQTRKLCMASDLVTQAIELMHPMAETAGVIVGAKPQPAPLFVDPDAILQVLTNLLSNAIKFSRAESAIQLAVEPGDEGVVFRVVDEGSGIKTDKLESIFERFHQVDASDSRRRGGTGLGLYICRKIVQGHGGRIWAESEPGRGSTFTFTLPFAFPELRPNEQRGGTGSDSSETKG